MTEAADLPPTPADGTAPDPAPTGAWAELRHELATGDPGRLSAGVRAFRRGVVLLAVPVAATGALAVVLSIWAWRDRPLLAVIGALIALPAIVLPINAVRRTRAVALVAAHPRDALDQARDLLGRARHLPGIDELASSARQLRLSGTRPKPRQALKLLRQLSNTVEAAHPDPKQHPLLVGLHPEQLGKLWRGAGLSLTAWPIAGLVAVVALLAGLLG